MQHFNHINSNHPLVSSTERTMVKTVVIFDFDDTLFPTTKLKEILKRPNPINYGQQKLRLSQAQLFAAKMTAQEIIEFTQLSWVTYNLLIQYIARYSKQNISIVTASQTGWVQKALSLVYNIGYFSHIYHLLFIKNTTNPLDNISLYNPSDAIMKSFKAAKNHREMASHPVFLWKYETFKQIFNQKVETSEHVINTFVIIGDSSFEYQAAKKLNKFVELVYGRNNRNIIIDAIKLVSKPTVGALLKQQNELYQLGQYGVYDTNASKCNYKSSNHGHVCVQQSRDSYAGESMLVHSHRQWTLQ